MSEFQPSNSVGDYEAKAHFSELLERVQGGEEVTITRHGSPVAKLVPVRRAGTKAERRAAIDRMQALARGRSLGGLRVKDLINEGRP